MTQAHEAPPAPEERILDVVGNLTRVYGLLGTRQQACSLVLTDQRIICAVLTKEKVREITGEAREAAKAEGKGVLGRVGAQAQAFSSYHRRYSAMSPEAILAETAGNFVIERSEIQKIKFRTGMIDDERNTSDQLTIKTEAEKLKFNVGGSLSAAKETFRSTGYAA